MVEKHGIATEGLVVFALDGCFWSCCCAFLFYPMHDIGDVSFGCVLYGSLYESAPEALLLGAEEVYDSLFLLIYSLVHIDLVSP